MNWSIYSKFVGDVFGAPLAIEGLAAFMLESTFLGLWIFGWDRLSKRVHLATVWLFAIGSWASAFFIISRQLVDAAARRLDRHRRPRGADGRLGALLEPLRDLGVHPRAARRAHDGDRRDLRRRLLAPRPRPEPGALPPRSEARADRRRPDLGGEPRGRQPDGRRRDRLPADEDRLDRGAVGHVPAVRVLALPDRRLHRGRPDAVVLDPGPAPPVDPRDPLLGWRGAGDERAPGVGSVASTAPATTSRPCGRPTGACGSWPMPARSSS